MRHALLGLLAVAALVAPATRAADAPAPVRVQTTVDPQTITIGSPVRYTMRVEASPDVELVVPTLQVRIGDFQVVDFGELPPREEQGRVVVERWYALLTYRTGDLRVPGPTVQYRVAGGDLQRLAAPDALVTVQSLLDRDGATAGEPRDIKGPVDVPRDYRPLVWLAAGLVGLAVLGAGAYRLLNRRRAPAAPPPRPAHEVALEALARLRAGRLLEAGRQEEYYVRLSAIVRTYLEARFGLRAPEMTSEEFLQAAQRDPRLTPSQRALLGQFLGEADLVKFARHVPTLDGAERAYQAAREVVESTRIAPEVGRAAA